MKNSPPRLLLGKICVEKGLLVFFYSATSTVSCRRRRIEKSWSYFTTKEAKDIKHTRCLCTHTIQFIFLFSAFMLSGASDTKIMETIRGVVVVCVCWVS